MEQNGDPFESVWNAPFMTPIIALSSDYDAINSSAPLMPLLQQVINEGTVAGGQPWELHSNTWNIAPAGGLQSTTDSYLIGLSTVAAHGGSVAATDGDASGTNVEASTGMADEIMYDQDEEEMCDDGSDDDISAPKAPSCDMTFESFKAAQAYYLNYARWHGFGVRIDYARQTNDGVIIRGRLVCTKAGKDTVVKEDTQKPKSVVPERRRNTTMRTDCKSLLMLKRVDGNYKVVEFFDTHNHPIIKKFNLVKYMRSHRDIPLEEREFLRILHRANVTTSRMMQIMAGIHKSLHNVTYTRKDVANFRASVRREHSITDIQDTLAYFQVLKS
ncbi:hypothetical protein BRADI_5g14050v3 [Brachypodium distachyon]|uniref:FAR1 domain-containing protein n=1 Tax=Brachypodium distachyon TaxID=15368 RepID=I1IZ34_BRADI|nr:hypothetical protein BRADI_5g14050v3 [Brachypodium distachyon]